LHLPSLPPLFSQSVELDVTLGRNAEGVRNAVEEREQRRDIRRFRDLWLCPSGITQQLNIGGRRARGAIGDLLHVVEQCAFRLGEASIV
jgi:hypothetical protein